MQGFFFYSKSGTCLCGKQSIERHTRSDSNGNNHKRRGFYIIKKINKDPFHIQHALTVEAVMKWYANELGYGEDAEYWGIVGLLRH